LNILLGCRHDFLKFFLTLGGGVSFPPWFLLFAKVFFELRTWCQAGDLVSVPVLQRSNCPTASVEICGVLDERVACFQQEVGCVLVILHRPDFDRMTMDDNGGPLTYLSWHISDDLQIRY
jgi:hypothetical protein